MADPRVKSSDVAGAVRASAVAHPFRAAADDPPLCPGLGGWVRPSLCLVAVWGWAGTVPL
jgi:hypothetical protein